MLQSDQKQDNSASEAAALKVRASSLQREVGTLTQSAVDRDQRLALCDKEIGELKMKIEEYSGKTAQTDAALSQNERAYAQKQTQNNAALEKALCALASERSANELLAEEVLGLRKRLEKLPKDLAASKAAHSASSSEVSILQMKVISLTRYDASYTCHNTHP